MDWAAENSEATYDLIYNTPVKEIPAVTKELGKDGSVQADEMYAEYIQSFEAPAPEFHSLIEHLKANDKDDVIDLVFPVLLEWELSVAPWKFQ